MTNSEDHIPTVAEPGSKRRRQSPEIGELAAALCQAQSEFPPVKAGTRGRDGNRRYNYADMAEYIAACKPHLKTNGLSYTQLPIEHGDMSKVTVETIVMHSSGQYIAGELDMPCEANAKSRGSAITYARRYSFAMMFGLAPVEDDDGDAAANDATPEAVTGEPVIQDILRLWQSLERTPEQLVELLSGQGVAKLSELSRSSLVGLRDRLVTLDAKKQAEERFS